MLDRERIILGKQITSALESAGTNAPIIEPTTPALWEVQKPERNALAGIITSLAYARMEAHVPTRPPFGLLQARGTRWKEGFEPFFPLINPPPIREHYGKMYELWPITPIGEDLMTTLVAAIQEECAFLETLPDTDPIKKVYQRLQEMLKNFLRNGEYRKEPQEGAGWVQTFISENSFALTNMRRLHFATRKRYHAQYDIDPSLEELVKVQQKKGFSLLADMTSVHVDDLAQGAIVLSPDNIHIYETLQGEKFVDWNPGIFGQMHKTAQEQTNDSAPYPRKTTKCVATLPTASLREIVKDHPHHILPQATSVVRGLFDHYLKAIEVHAEITT